MRIAIHKLKNRFRKHTFLGKRGKFSKSQLFAVTLVFAGIGAYTMFSGFAAGPFASVEPESGTITAPSAVINDSSASGGKYVQFGAGSTGSLSPGVFVSRAEFDRAKQRAQNTAEPFRSSYNNQKSRADSLLSSTPNPFYMEQADYLQNIRYAWSWSSCPDNNSSDNNSLADATSKLESQGANAAILARQYALTGDTRYGDKAKEYLVAWANRSTPVNMYDFHTDPVTFNSGLRGDNGTDCFRPWNFALDGLFQGYGLIGFSDAYVLLVKNGYNLSSTEDAAVKAYIKRLTEAVNSSFQTWTRWADNHRSSSSYIRYRADNHLSWGLAPLLSAAVALNDEALANYVLTGGSWNDSRSGPYANPSHVRDVIDRAVLSDGQIIDEAPGSVGGFGRDGYAMYHLWAMQLVAKIGETHYGQDVWSYKGSDGKGLQESYARYVSKITSGEESSASWQYELIYNRWPTTEFKSARDSTNRLAYILQSIGPVVLLWGQ